jgi:hypothetical protein
MRPEHRVPRGPDAPPTLAEAGIGKHLADRARKVGALFANAVKAKSNGLIGYSLDSTGVNVYGVKLYGARW